MFSDPKKADVKRLSEVIKWMNVDLQKEETDTLEASGLTWEEANGQSPPENARCFSP